MRPRGQTSKYLPWISPAYPANPLGGISFATSTDEDLLTLTSGLTRDLSTKRNLGLVIARMLGWRRLMFLDDDIYDVSKEDADGLAVGLDDHNVSVLIPDQFPDNSVACHAHRLGGGQQGKFASAGGMGVRCDRDDLAFFPNIYNEDWFFFSEEAASHKIARVGYHASESTTRTKILGEPSRKSSEICWPRVCMHAWTLIGISLGVDAAYWADFIESRRDFLRRVAVSLRRKLKTNLDDKEDREVRAAQVSIHEAQRQLGRIDPRLCQKFIDLWQTDLGEWRSYLTKLPHLESVVSALDHLGLDYRVFSPNIR